jgi:hypothetical protein
MNEQDLRDCFAMFAMLGWTMNGDYHEAEIPRKAYRLADAMIEQRNKGESDEQTNNGIAAVAPKRTRKR